MLQSVFPKEPVHEGNFIIVQKHCQFVEYTNNACFLPSFFCRHTIVFAEATLPAGSYVIVLCTFEPQQEGTYDLTVHCEKDDFELTPLGEDLSFVKLKEARMIVRTLMQSKSKQKN